jgi:hypothetical protein
MSEAILIRDKHVIRMHMIGLCIVHNVLKYFRKDS